MHQTGWHHGIYDFSFSLFFLNWPSRKIEKNFDAKSIKTQDLRAVLPQTPAEYEKGQKAWIPVALAKPRPKK